MKKIITKEVSETEFDTDYTVCTGIGNKIDDVAEFINSARIKGATHIKFHTDFDYELLYLYTLIQNVETDEEYEKRLNEERISKDKDIEVNKNQRRALYEKLKKEFDN